MPIPSCFAPAYMAFISLLFAAASCVTTGQAPLGESLTPPCRIHPDFTATPDSPANAGCLVKSDGELLLIEQRLSGKTGIPGGGSEDNESSRCTAHRETWEETGYDVEVGRLLQQFDNGFRLYACAIAGRQQTAAHDTVEVARIFWLNPEQITGDEYRFPEQLDAIRSLFQSLP